MGMNDDAILNNISKEEWDRGTEKLMTNNQERRVKQAVDLVWSHVSPEQLEKEINQRFRDADMNTRISIEVHRQ